MSRTAADLLARIRIDRKHDESAGLDLLDLPPRAG
jgi:hypothetical protein